MKQKQTSTVRHTIELRSEEVQELMESTPPCILRVGIGIILLITLGFFVASMYIRYPSYVTVRMKLLSQHQEEYIRCPEDAEILSALESTLTNVNKGDTLCTILTQGGDTIYLKTTRGGQAKAVDILVCGISVEKGTMMYVIDNDETSSQYQTTDVCIYVPEEENKKYSPGNTLQLRIGNEPIEMKVVSQTKTPNEAGEYAIRCRAKEATPNNLHTYQATEAQLLTDDKTIFEKFFRKRI